MVTQQPYYTPAPGAPPPYLPPPPPAQPPARRGVPAPVIVLLVLLVFVGAGGFLAWGAFSERVLEPRRVAGTVREYYDLMDAGEWNRAHARLSAATQATTTPAMLESAWRAAANGPYGVPYTPSVDEVRIETANGRTAAVAEISYSTSRGASMGNVQVPLVREGGAWKLAKVP